MKFVINADTPEEMRRAIVEWLNQRASERRRDAMIARRKTIANAYNDEADAYDDAAKFINNIDIQPLRKSAFYNPEGEKPII